MLIIDFFPYILLLFITILLPKILKKNYIPILGIIYVLFCGFRYGVGWDYFNYIFTIKEGGWYITRMEFIVRQIAYLAHILDNPRIFFIVTSFLITFFFFKTINKLSLVPRDSVFIYLCLPAFFISSLTTVRFSLAIALFFYATIFLGKNWVLYLIFFILSILSHKSAVIGVFVIPFLCGIFKVNKFWNILIFMISFGFSQFYSFSSSVSFVLSYIGGYLDGISDIAEQGLNYLNNADSSGFSKSPYMYAFINIFNLVFYKRLTQSGGEKVARYITLYNLGCSVMFLLSFDQVFASRLAQPFIVYVILLAPFYRILLNWRYIVYMVCVFVFIFQLSVKGSHADFPLRRNCYIPYKMSLE